MAADTVPDISEPSSPDRVGELGVLLGDVTRNLGTLARQHAELLRADVGRQLGTAGQGAADVAGAAALTATATVFGGLAAVHALHRATRMPLWSCYAAVAAALASGGVALAARGGRRLATIRPAPETLATLREDVEWLKNQIGRPET